MCVSEESCSLGLKVLKILNGVRVVAVKRELLACFFKVADPERLELPTPAFEAQCSIQLSYGSVARAYKPSRFSEELKESW